MLQKLMETNRLPEILTGEEIRHIESEVKYEGYIKKQEKEIARLKKTDRIKIPKNIEFVNIPGLTREVAEKLERMQPKTIGEAKKIPGITPAAIINLDIYLRIQARKQQNNVPRETLT